LAGGIDVAVGEWKQSGNGWTVVVAELSDVEVFDADGSV
jgi:hypothetical protein